MKSAPVSRVKASLSEYIRRAKAGEEVIITERGRPVARLVPFRGGDTLGDGLVELAKEGVVRLGTGKLPARFWKLPRPADPRALVRAALTEERERGW
jgi:prevent-host-death family protein